MYHSGGAKRWVSGLVLCAALLGLASIANAEFSGAIFRADVCRDGVCIGYYQETDPNNGTWNGDTFVWSLPSAVDIVDTTTGEYLATLNDGNVTMAVLATDPQVNLGFSVTAGTSDTTFTISSALVSFATIANPSAHASVAWNLTDQGSDGALLSPVVSEGLNRCYFAQYNGFVPSGTSFAELVPGIAADPESSTPYFEDAPAVGFDPIGQPVSDMSAQIHFTLSADDFASGTSTYVIIPEPASLLLLVASLALARRR
jgi:hypothetical protein